MSYTATVGNKTIILNDSERQQCEIWSRVMGYVRPVSEWNVGKQGEFLERIEFGYPLDLDEWNIRKKLFKK